MRKFVFTAYGGEAVAQAVACRFQKECDNLLLDFDTRRGQDWSFGPILFHVYI